MATNGITASEARAWSLFENAANWARGTAVTVTGAVVGVVLFSSESRPGVVYLTRCDGAACNCPAYARGIRQCCHMRACRMEAEQAREAVGLRAPASKIKAPAGYGKTCRATGCQDDPEPGSPYCYRHALVDAF